MLLLDGHGYWWLMWLRHEKMKKLNVNQYVYFKLLPDGIKIWEKDFNKYAPEGYHFATHFAEYTKDGITKMQMHTFLELFGQHINQSSSYNVLEGNNLYFDEKDLETVTL